jgi:DNA modification methylase
MAWHPGIPEEYRNQIVTGDARELAKRIPNESVDLIFTDPVYDRIEDYAWLGELGARVLRDGGWLVAYYGIGYLPDTAAALSASLTFEWQHINYMPTLNARGAYKTFSNYRGLLRYRKGNAQPQRHMRDLQVDSFVASNSGHIWAKNTLVVLSLTQALTADSGIVYDPFTGGGTVPAVCKMLGRNYIASEINPDTAESARERVLFTQPPLPGLEYAQSVFE